MRILFLSLIAAVAFNAQAGQEGGGGGLGIGTEKGIYLYDFLEGGIEETAYINSQVTDEMGAAPHVQNTAAPIEVQSIIVKKLNEVYRISPEIALDLLNVIKTYQWRYTLPKVQETNDRGYSPVIILNKEIQIAYRDDNYKIVTIDREYFKKMPLNHQAGLYFHEITYALVIADSEDLERYYFTTTEFSYRARAFTSYLFHPNFKNQTLDLFVDFYKRTILKHTIESRKKGLSSKPMPTYLSYSNYTYFKSPEFSRKCSAFKAEATQVAIEAGAAFTHIVDSVLSPWKNVKIASDCYTQSFPFVSMSFTGVGPAYVSNSIIQGSSYYFPFYDYSSATISSNFEIRCGKTSKKYNINTTRLKNAVAASGEIATRSSKEFFNLCLDKDLQDNIAAMARMNVLNQNK